MGHNCPLYSNLPGNFITEFQEYLRDPIRDPKSKIMELLTSETSEQDVKGAQTRGIEQKELRDLETRVNDLRKEARQRDQGYSASDSSFCPRLSSTRCQTTRHSDPKC